MRHALLLFLLIFSFRFRAAGQECTTYVVVNAFEPKLGIDIQTLKADDFEARTDGTPLPIVSATTSYTSRLLVLLETDGAAKDSKIGDVVDMVTRMARQAPEGQPLAFGVYAERAVFTKKFFADSKERNTAIGAVIEEANSLGNRVAMYEALHQALQLFGEHQPGDTVLLVGYPYDDKSHRSAGEVQREFLASGVRLLVMLREPLSKASRDFAFNPHLSEQNMFLKVTMATGGAYSDWDPHFFGWNWRGYMLGVKLPDHQRKNKPTKWKLRLRGVAGDSFRKSKLYHPEELPPCNSQPTAAR
jgi:hypothetical protein